MLHIDGIPPKLINQECEALVCQQYRYRGRLEQEVDCLSLKVNRRWHQLYFDEGIVFWRAGGDGPRPSKQQPDSPFAYPLVDLGDKLGVEGCVIEDCTTEPLPGGARVTFAFENKGALIVVHSDNSTSLRFISAA